MARKYRPQFYTADKLKRVPTIVLNASYAIRKAFFEGFYAGDGTKGGSTHCNLDNGCYNPERPEMSQKGKVTCQGLYYLTRSLGYENLVVKQHSKKNEHCYTITTRRDPIEEVMAIFQFEELADYNKHVRFVDKNTRWTSACLNQATHIDQDNVYDIETADGTFLGGVGNVMTFQTDSVKYALKSSTPSSKGIKTRTTRLRACLAVVPGRVRPSC
jgi:hypothetical protein